MTIIQALDGTEVELTDLQAGDRVKTNFSDPDWADDNGLVGTIEFMDDIEEIEGEEEDGRNCFVQLDNGETMDISEFNLLKVEGE